MKSSALWLVVLVAVLVGCVFECPEDATDRITCNVNSECDDGNDCTADACDADGTCVNVYLPELLCPEPSDEPEPTVDDSEPEPNPVPVPVPDPDSSAIFCFFDGDGDGYGVSNARASYSEETGCPLNYSIRAGDCDDTAWYAHPGYIELCDGVDNDCDGEVDEPGDEDSEIGTDCLVILNPGHDPVLMAGSVTCVYSEELERTDPHCLPICGDEVCDGIDNDCNGIADDEDMCGE